MTELMTFVLIGITTGSVYGLAAMGLVLTYKTSGIFNFGHGAIAAAAAFVFYELHTVRGLPWPVALIVAVVALPPMMALVLERITRVLSRGTPTLKIVGTVGLQLAIVGSLLAVYGGSMLDFPAFLPIDTVELLGVLLGVDQLITAGLAAAGAVGFFVFFRMSAMGVRMRAVVDDPDLLSLSGTSPFVVRSWAWLIGTWFAALSGAMLAPTIGLDAMMLTLLVVQAFGAAAVGRFSSLPMTYVGGLLVGVLAALATNFVSGSEILSGLPPAIPFLVLFVVLLVVPRGKLVEIGGHRVAPLSAPLVSTRTARILGLLAIVVGALVPFVVGAKLPVYASALVLVLVFYSLNLLVRTSGQISLAHAGLVAVGSAAFSHLAVGAGLPWLMAVVLAGVVAIPVGALVAVPSIRLSGLYLALATFGFGLLLENVLYRSELMFGPTNTLPAHRPALFEGDTAFYYVLLAFAIGCGVVISMIGRSRLGRLLRALADSPTTLSTLGLGTNVTRMTVFAISAFIAGVAGALWASNGHSATGAPFTSFVSLTWLAILFLHPGTGAAQPIFAATALGVVPAYITNETVNEWTLAFFGIAAVLVAIYESTRTAHRSAARHVTAANSSRAADRLAGTGPAAERLRSALGAASKRSTPDSTRVRVATSISARTR
ncbi:ABC transporter permease [Haloechinothrix salitolerans]|uniref:ABC transporter permease n=1 Tax=Haloechinothrix salitolerans TaxID=926830 RepID=A0ABW2C460_9PSEU